jgi:adenylate kinase
MSDLRKVALLIGPPGSGKGTIGHALAITNDFCHFAIGNAFRALKKGTFEGDLHAEYVARGELLPDDFTFKILMNGLNDGFFLEEPLCHKTLVLDGYPRTRQQLDDLQEHFRVSAAAVIECDEDKLLARCLARATASGRQEDNNPETTKKRIERYKQTTQPLLDMIPSEDIIVVDNNGELETSIKKVTQFFVSKISQIY